MNRKPFFPVVLALAVCLLWAAGCSSQPATPEAPQAPAPAQEPPPQTTLAPPSEAAPVDRTAQPVEPPAANPPLLPAPPAEALACTCPQEPRHHHVHREEEDKTAPVVIAPPLPPVVKEPPSGPPMAVLGRKVVDTGGDDIGRVVDLLVDQRGHAHAVVIDFGGFLGVGNRRVAVDWSNLEFNSVDSDQPIVLKLDRDKLKDEPDYRGPPVGASGAPTK
jgi:hypothetical protein